MFPRFLRGSPNRPRFKFNPPGLNRSILIYEYPPIRSGGRKRDSRVIYDRIRSVICKKSIIYGRHRRRSGRFLGAGEAGGEVGARSAPDSPHRARVSLYTERDLSRRRPRTCLEHRRPPATCTSLLGRALAAWENTSKLAGTRPLSANNSVPAFLHFVNSSSYFASIFSQTSLSLPLSLVSQFVEYKISPRTFPFPYLFVTGTVISFELIKNSKNNPIKLSLSLSLSFG